MVKNKDENVKNCIRNCLRPTFHTDFNNSPQIPLCERCILDLIISVPYYNKMSCFAFIILFSHAAQ